jgi:hypothetical protein
MTDEIKGMDWQEANPEQAIGRMNRPNEGDLRVWWIPQVPMHPFLKKVRTVAEGLLLLDTLASYDYFQHENNIKPDYSNAGGLSIFIAGDWEEWLNGDGVDVDELMNACENVYECIDQLNAK